MKNRTTIQILIFLAFTVNAVLTVFGFAALLDSPYTGIRMEACGDHVCVKSVDTDGPAHGKVRPGDRLLKVGELRMPSFAFSSDPDYISSRSDQRTFWELQRPLGALVVKDRLAVLSFARNGESKGISLTPGSFPALRAIAATLPQYAVGWTFIIVAYLVIRKKENHLSTANFIIGAFAGAAFITLAPYSVRDMVFPAAAFRTLSVMNYLATQTFCYALLHIALVFPREKGVLQKHPRVLAVPYILLAVVTAAHYGGLFENTHLTTYMSMNACMLATLGMFVFDFLRERNPVYRKQVQWVVIGSLAGISSWLIMTSLPIVFGIPHFAQEISILPTVVYPLSFAFAVTRYRLMEIDNILDTAVVYGFTIAILAAIETVFLSFASPYLLAAGRGLPALSVIAVLLIVFIYVPVRNVVKGVVERLFRRGKYDPEIELQQFMLQLGLCDERSALDKFASFVKGLLKPSGIALFKIAGDRASVINADAGRVQSGAGVVLSQASVLWERLRDRGAGVFGYELADHGVLDVSTTGGEVENALFVPFLTDPADAASGYLAVLLRKWNGTAYTAKDVTLLNAVSVNIANIIDAGELRKERSEIEERFRKEKDDVMKELHHGLGAILENVTAASREAGKLLDKDDRAAQALVRRIGEFSSEAVDLMRTGLSVLDNHQGDLGSIMGAVKERFGDVFESSGMELHLDCSDDAVRLRPGALVALNVTRVIQEALGNVLRHSGAKQARIGLTREEQRLFVTIADDGKGFDGKGSAAGRGLLAMRRLVEDLGGSFTVTSSPGKGAEIAFSVLAAN